MASVSKDSKGYRIRFVTPDGFSKCIRVAGFNKARSEEIARHIKELIAAKSAGTAIERRTASWLADIGIRLHSKLVAIGLAAPRLKESQVKEPERPVAKLGTFLAEYREDGRKATGEHAAELTVVKWRAPMDSLLRFFGNDRDIASITYEDAHMFRKWLDDRRICKTKENPKGRPLAENTKRKHVEHAKVFFNGAKRRGLIQRNPFENLVSSTRPNRERDYFLNVEDAERIIEVCPDAEWRLLISLWRYAGLRKMEVFELTWGDVLWNQGRMRVHATKTAGYDGKEIRYVPIRDIRQFLLDAMQSQLADGAVSLPADAPIITRFSKSNSNLDKPMKSILHRAGMVPWPKLFQNMRASCETEWLNEGHPAHVVAAWIGHSVRVQRDHYAQVTDDHYERFNGPLSSSEKSGHQSGHEVTRSAMKRPELRGPLLGKVAQKTQKPRKTLGSTGFQIAAEGFEPPTRGL